VGVLRCTGEALDCGWTTICIAARHRLAQRSTTRLSRQQKTFSSGPLRSGDLCDTPTWGVSRPPVCYNRPLYYIILISVTLLALLDISHVLRLPSICVPILHNLVINVVYGLIVMHNKERYSLPY
jgi:steroid 5-alpha reductase family enzyme